MYYGRKIKYLEWRKNQEKICTAGFVKAEGFGEQCKVQIRVTGWPAAADGAYEVWREGQDETRMGTVSQGGRQGSRKLGDVILEDGKGSLVQKVSSAEEWFEAGKAERVCSIRIPIRKDEELYCQWSEYMPQIQPAEEVSAANAAESAEELRKTETAEEKENAEETEKTEGTVESEVTTEQKKISPHTLTYLKEHKWQQLSEIYPHISPFRDERDYLSVTPGDFVILPERYYSLVGNSFLLHGYYNYGHLVLCRKLWRGQERYYLGVPGNFFEREREVALLFGFESFESKQEPASDGDYGYYLKCIEL